MSRLGDVTSVVLDATVFYPGGGGQPSDRGLLLRADDGRTWIVRAARKVEGEIVHELEPSEGDPPAEGDRITVDLDWARRLSLMRTHTALHALSGVVWRDHGAQVTGSNMEPGSGRLDFELESITGDLVDAIEATVNVELAAARDVRVDVLPREAAFAIPDLDPYQGQPPPARHRGGPHHRDRGPRPPGGQRHPCREHARGRQGAGDGLRIEGTHQQAHPDRHRRRRRLGLMGPNSASG